MKSASRVRRAPASAVLLAALVVLVLLAELAPTSAATRTARDPLLPGLGGSTVFRVVDHNTAHRRLPLRKALATAHRVRAQAITLQEVCARDVRRLRRDHPGWTVSYLQERRVPWCARGSMAHRRRHPATIGSVAVWTGGGSGRTSTVGFGHQYDRTWYLGMACVTYRDHTWVHVCSTHLLAGRRTYPRRVRIRRQQAREVRLRTDGWIADHHLVIVGGDFNAGPSSAELNNLYELGGHGRFSESSAPPRGRGDCRCAVPTRNGTKIDYVFYSRNRFPVGSPRKLTLLRTRSDHDLLVSVAQIDLALIPGL